MDSYRSIKMSDKSHTIISPKIVDTCFGGALSKKPISEKARQARVANAEKARQARAKKRVAAQPTILSSPPGDIARPPSANIPRAKKPAKNPLSHTKTVSPAVLASLAKASAARAKKLSDLKKARTPEPKFEEPADDFNPFQWESTESDESDDDIVNTRGPPPIIIRLPAEISARVIYNLTYRIPDIRRKRFSIMLNDKKTGVTITPRGNPIFTPERANKFFYAVIMPYYDYNGASLVLYNLNQHPVDFALAVSIDINCVLKSLMQLRPKLAKNIQKYAEEAGFVNTKISNSSVVNKGILDRFQSKFKTRFVVMDPACNVWHDTDPNDKRKYKKVLLFAKDNHASVYIPVGFPKTVSYVDNVNDIIERTHQPMKINAVIKKEPEGVSIVFRSVVVWNTLYKRYKPPTPYDNAIDYYSCVDEEGFLFTKWKLDNHIRPLNEPQYSISLMSRKSTGNRYFIPRVERTLKTYHHYDMVKAYASIKHRKYYGVYGLTVGYFELFRNTNTEYIFSHPGKSYVTAVTYISEFARVDLIIQPNNWYNHIELSAYIEDGLLTVEISHSSIVLSPHTLDLPLLELTDDNKHKNNKIIGKFISGGLDNTYSETYLVKNDTDRQQLEFSLREKGATVTPAFGDDCPIITAEYESERKTQLWHIHEQITAYQRSEFICTVAKYHNVLVAYCVDGFLTTTKIDLECNNKPGGWAYKGMTTCNYDGSITPRLHLAEFTEKVQKMIDCAPEIKEYEGRLSHRTMTNGPAGCGKSFISIYKYPQPNSTVLMPQCTQVEDAREKIAAKDTITPVGGIRHIMTVQKVLANIKGRDKKKYGDKNNNNEYGGEIDIPHDYGYKPESETYIIDEVNQLSQGQLDRMIQWADKWRVNLRLIGDIMKLEDENGDVELQINQRDPPAPCGEPITEMPGFTWFTQIMDKRRQSNDDAKILDSLIGQDPVDQYNILCAHCKEISLEDCITELSLGDTVCISSNHKAISDINNKVKAIVDANWIAQGIDIHLIEYPARYTGNSKTMIRGKIYPTHNEDINWNRQDVSEKSDKHFEACYARTSDSVEGATISGKIIIDCRMVRQKGFIYTAATRCTSLANVFLIYGNVTVIPKPLKLKSTPPLPEDENIRKLREAKFTLIRDVRNFCEIYDDFFRYKKRSDDEILDDIHRDRQGRLKSDYLWKRHNATYAVFNPTQTREEEIKERFDKDKIYEDGRFDRFLKQLQTFSAEFPSAANLVEVVNKLKGFKPTIENREEIGKCISSDHDTGRGANISKIYTKDITTIDEVKLHTSVNLALWQSSTILVKTKTYREIAGEIYQKYLATVATIPSIKESTPPAEPVEEVKKIDFYDHNIAKFTSANIIRVDLGGDNGNRAFNYESYGDYMSSRIIERLLGAMGENFNLNEYPSADSNILTRLWLDIDMKVSEAKVSEIVDFLDKAIPAGDNKVLQSTKGKLHIVLNISSAQPLQQCERVHDGKEYKYIPTGDVSWDNSNNGRTNMLLFFKTKLREIMADETTDQEWNTAFDMKAKGMRAAYAIKMKGGICVSRGYYTLHDIQGMLADNTEKASIILDCSIYKPVTGSINPNLYGEIDTIANNYEAKKEESAKRLAEKYSSYKYENGVITKAGVRYEITQKFIDDLIRKLPSDCLTGGKWRYTIRNIAAASLAIPEFSPQYTLHEWSAKGGEYNKDRNDEIWSFMIKNVKPEDTNNAICWLMCKSTSKLPVVESKKESPPTCAPVKEIRAECVSAPITCESINAICPVVEEDLYDNPPIIIQVTKPSHHHVVEPDVEFIYNHIFAVLGYTAVISIAPVCALLNKTSYLPFESSLLRFNISAEYINNIYAEKVCGGPRYTNVMDRFIQSDPKCIITTKQLCEYIKPDVVDYVWKHSHQVLFSDWYSGAKKQVMAIQDKYKHQTSIHMELSREETDERRYGHYNNRARESTKWRPSNHSQPSLQGYNDVRPIRQDKAFHTAVVNLLDKLVSNNVKLSTIDLQYIITACGREKNKILAGWDVVKADYIDEI